jgi:surfeit locus 1 family protein
VSRTREVLLRPGRIGTIAFVLAVAVACVLLGRWQLSRLQERRDLNAALEARSAEAPMTFDELVEAHEAGTSPEDLEFRRVTVEGQLATEFEVLQRNRGHQGQQGFHVVTPLIVRTDLGILVRRGWVPVALDDPPVLEAAAPGGTVTVSGLLRAPERHDGFGPRDPETGDLARVFWADPQRLDDQVPFALVDMVVDLQSLDPPHPGELPEPLPPLEFDEANHLAYAVQWFSFAVIAIVGLAAYARTRWFREPPS